ncbi:MAG: hypothetical protein Kilf2KO_06580 [Rhodospirillales bacterium]
MKQVRAAKQGASKSGTGRAATRQARRRQLIDATIDSISKRGFSGTTLETVTKGAKLSHGVVHFYFDSKESLYVETLGFLAREHYELWHGAMLKAGDDPVRQLTAIVASDFAQSVCSPKKLAVWYAFWGQAKYRPNYLKIHSGYDEQRFVEIARLCREIAADGGYEGLDSDRVARGLEALIDGLWLNLLLYPKTSGRTKSLDDALCFLACAFPRHFAQPGEAVDLADCCATPSKAKAT